MIYISMPRLSYSSDPDKGARDAKLVCYNNMNKKRADTDM